MLDNRLKMCAEMVSGKGAAVDVGTDHAMLAAELVMSGKCSRVIASDVKEGPLESAKRTIERCGVADRVELILSDGLDNVPLEGVTDIVIAGMGGETIADIIGNTSIARYEQESVRWILQPMSKPEYLRRMIYEYQMRITSERIVEDGERLYVVMCAEYNPEFRYLTEFDALNGFFDDDDPLAKKYRERESERLKKISQALESAGKTDEAVHYNALSRKLAEGVDEIEISSIYSHLDSLCPFCTQEKWDNSGLLVENRSGMCDTVVLSLDITDRVVDEAACKWADLIISHHPVIFDPLKKITRTSPVFRLIETDIAAICAHTNLDIASWGTNGVILRKLCERFAITAEAEPLEELGGGNTLGWIVELPEKLRRDDFAAVLKEIFGCEYVRMSAHGRHFVQRIAFCSGAGDTDEAMTALEKGCDALVTGDVKHDVWIDSENHGIVLFDCGHFHTENLVLRELRRVLEEKFPRLDIEIAERSTDPCAYV